jgi:uncharacterized protein YcfJ
MNVYKLLLGPVIGGVIGAGAINAHGYNSDSNIVEAAVVSAIPVYKTVQINNPVQQCWQESVSVPQNNYASRTPEILGAIVGAGVGRLFGSGRGQDVATVAGAVLGGSIGRDQKYKYNQKNASVRYEERCRTVDNIHREERLDGYDVTYEYDGNIYRTHTRADPGRTITISVNVVPVET